MRHTVPVLSQVPVVVTIVGIDAHSEVYYTYDDPLSGHHHYKSPKCIINAVSPYQTLFALDYASSRNGWIVTTPAIPQSSTSRSVQPLIPSSPDFLDARLALITYNRTELDYSFDVVFFNQITRTQIWDDPQEGNPLNPVKVCDPETDHAPHPRRATSSPNM